MASGYYNELTIEGPPDQLHQVKLPTGIRELVIDRNQGSTLPLSFLSSENMLEWAISIEQEYPSLKVKLYWVDLDQPPNYGIYDQGGEKSIVDQREAELAVKVLYEYHYVQDELKSFFDIQKFLQQGQIMRWEINPLAQAWAVPEDQLPTLKVDPNNPLKIITFYSKNGEVYHAKCRYDPQTNQIFPP